MAVSHWATSSRENAHASARALAKELGVQGSTPAELLKGLRAVDGVQLNIAASKMAPVMVSVRQGSTRVSASLISEMARPLSVFLALQTSMLDELMWLPVVEDDLPGSFQTEDPAKLVREGKFSDVPLMSGVVGAEGLVWVLRKLYPLYLIIIS